VTLELIIHLNYGSNEYDIYIVIVLKVFLTHEMINFSNI